VEGPPAYGNRAMKPILLGVLGYALSFVFDWASWRRLRLLKPLFGLSAVIALGTALVWVLSTPGSLPWPSWLLSVGWPLLLASGVLLFYSLFFEIPFTATYARQGAGKQLVTTGTYALTRHPGVLWMAFLMLSLTLVTRLPVVAIAAIVWTALDVLYVWLQEVLLFRRMFPGYADYQQSTPMLLPTRQSVRRCLHTLAHRQRSE
jgi:protein-S-isoprenylcysteine O-methyltransferase Ste14